MFFSESKQLVKDHPALEHDVQAIDELLSSQSHTAVLCSEILAGVLKLPESRVQNIMTQLATLALLNIENVYECRWCGIYTPVTDVDVSLISECSACGKKLKLSAKSKTRSVFLFSEQTQQKLSKAKIRQRSELKVDPNLFCDPAFKRANARRLLKSLFPNSQIDNFLSVHFPDVYDEISLSMSREAKLNLLFQMKPFEEIIEAIKQIS